MPHCRALLCRLFLLLALVPLVSSLLSAQRVPDAITGLEITPDGGTATVNVGSTANELAFFAHNGLTTGGSEVLVRFNAATAGTGRITLTASPGGETGYVNVTVQSLGPPTVALHIRSEGHRTVLDYKPTGVLKGLLTRASELNVETWEETAGAADLAFQWRDQERRFDYDAKGNLQADTSAWGQSYPTSATTRVTCSTHTILLRRAPSGSMTR